MPGAAGACVVVVSYRTGPALWPALRSALDQPQTRCLVVVDNGNDPGVVDGLSALAGLDPRLVLLTGQGNVGFARGCNLGAAEAGRIAAGDDVLVFMNPDCELPPGALAPLLQALAADPGAAAAAPLLVDETGTVQVGTPRNALSPGSILGEAFGLHRLNARLFPPLNRHAEPMGDAPFAVPACSGALIAIRRRVFDALGGFDEGYFLHVEDLDLCRRINDAGGRILCVPAVRVLHHGSTSRAPAKVVEAHKARGFARYLARHFGTGPGIRLLTLLIWCRWCLKFAWRRG